MNFIDIKLLWRDWRGGQLNLIISALVLAVMVVTAVSLLADRVERGLNQQITSFLASDLALRGDVEIEQKYLDRIKADDLQSANTATFRSMVFWGDNSHLASIKAVEEDYPLRGKIEVSGLDELENTTKLSHGPASGEAWVEPRLLNLLDIKLGDKLEVGYSQLTVTRLIVNEPDRGTGFAIAGARVMMNYGDLTESQLIRPGSRIRYRLLMAGEEQNIANFSEWFNAQSLSQESNTEINHYRLLTPENSQERLSEALGRGRAFLLLSGTIGVLLAGLAMALASHRYASRLTDQVALMKAWGQPSNTIRRSQFSRLLIIAAISTLIGVALGWLVHYLLLEIARGFFNAQLPQPGLRPWLIAVVTGFVSVIGFALPALWHLPSIAPLKVLRRDLPDDLVSQGRRLLIGISALLILTLWYSGSLIMSVVFLGALFSLFGVCALIALQILKLVQRFGQWRGSYVRLGLANLWRRRSQTMVQLVGFSTTLMLLLIVVGLRTSLIAEWQEQLPDNAPSHFLFNVAGSELEPIKEVLVEENVEAIRWYPMVRGRLVGLNGEPLTLERLRQADGLEREVNFTQSATPPTDNGIVAGEWWSEDDIDTNQFSIEQEVASQLGVTIGDIIEFSIGGITFSATLTSVRTVDWQSMNPNFYIVFKPGLLDRFAPNWITGVRDLDADSAQGQVFKKASPFVSRIIKQYPAAVVLEISQIIERIREVITRVSQGLELILLMVLACGGLVLFAAIGVSFDERLRDNAVLRTLGSSRKIVLGALTTEFAVLGFIAGLIASFGAEVVLYFVQIKVFNMAPNLHPLLWVIGLLAGVSLITVLGLLRSREIITVPPLQSLRQVS